MDRNEAIKIVKSHYPANKQMLNEALEFLIPELKESEDEKVRKHIISVLEDCWQTCKNIDYDSSRIQEDIAWLEKQGKSFNVFTRLKESKDLDDFTREYSFNIPSDIYNCLPKEKQSVWINEIENAIKAGAQWFEKQAEQKPTIEMKSAEESLGIDSETYNKIVNECIYGEQKPWSEDDDKIRTKIIKVLLDSELTPEETNECIFWLKSIKQRIGG